MKTQDKTSQPIKVGDHVETPFRRGRREGDVEKIVESENEAKKEGVNHPPKVIFHDQNDHKVAHNPETLEVTDAEYKEREIYGEYG